MKLLQFTDQPSTYATNLFTFIIVQRSY